MTLIQSMKDICNEVGVEEPSYVIGSTDERVKKLLSLARRVGNDLRAAVRWPELARIGSITLVASQAGYALPGDFDRPITDTWVNTSSDWPLYGPVTESEWAASQLMGASAVLDQEFRIMGCSSSQIQIFPTPTSGEAGEIVTFEYRSRNVFRPRTWYSGMVVTNASYCFYNGYYFYAATGGTTGATAPTPTGLNDGGVVWTLFTGAYDRPLADTDEIVIDVDLWELGVQWNYKASVDLPYEHLAKKYFNTLATIGSKLRGARTLYLGAKVNNGPNFNVPETGYGV